MDLALAFDPTASATDLARTADRTDILADNGLETAVRITLETDRRAKPDDVIPDGTTNRRGWWADEYAEVPGDLIGSRRWLLDRSKWSPEVAKRLQEYDTEALAWLVEDGVAARVIVQVDPMTPAAWAAGGWPFREHGYLESIAIVRPSGALVGFRYALNWQAQIQGRA